MSAITIKKIYAPVSKSDGYRVFVDRLWPRGLKKENAHFDIWMKDIAPTPELRKWFNHEPEKFHSFGIKYKTELEHNKAVQTLTNAVKDHPVITLLYAAKDEHCNHALVLKEYLEEITQ